MNNTFTEFAPAKINLYLHVLGRREDGYHQIKSLVAFADIGDEVQVTDNPAGDISLKTEGSFAHDLAGPQERNLVWRAVAEAREAFGVVHGADVTLIKRLPVAAGIGGGSADAAATLRALQKAWSFKTDEGWLDVAKKLGADVPVCFLSRSRRISDIGDIMEEAHIAPHFIVLVNPCQLLLTKDVFNVYAEGVKEVSNMPNSALWLFGTRNDLEGAAMKLLPVIKDALKAISRHMGCKLARMSGSGATCFGLFDTEAEAKEAAEHIQKTYPLWWVRQARIPFEGGTHGW